MNTKHKCWLFGRKKRFSLSSLQFLFNSVCYRKANSQEPALTVSLLLGFLFRQLQLLSGDVTKSVLVFWALCAAGAYVLEKYVFTSLIHILFQGKQAAKFPICFEKCSHLLFFFPPMSLKFGQYGSSNFEVILALGAVLYKWLTNLTKLNMADYLTFIL